MGLPASADKQGYTLVDPGRYPTGTDDFSAQINQFKKAGVEIVTGVPIPPDFTTFWKQAQQQGFKPKVVVGGQGAALPARSRRWATRATACRRRSGGRPTTRSRPP